MKPGFLEYSPLLSVGEGVGFWIWLTAGLGLVLLGVCWPGRGLLSTWRRMQSRVMRIACEDALKHIHNEIVSGQQPTPTSVAGALQLPLSRATDLLADMERKQLIHFQNGSLRLTGEGQRYALHVIRAHRLWERYLAEETGFTEGEWHRRAERLEHDLSPAAADNLYLRLNRPSHDPHGDPIPTADGRLEVETGQSLAALAPDTAGHILHLEDEPPSVYAQLTAQGLRPGMDIRVLEKSEDRIRFWAGGDEHVLATLLANNVTVAPVPRLEIPSGPRRQVLAQLKFGEQARVKGLDPACRGADRRRLLDLGFVPGAAVVAEIVSPSGDPTAYRIRGTLIALRREQASLVQIVPEEKALAI